MEPHFTDGVANEADAQLRCFIETILKSRDECFNSIDVRDS